MSKLPEEPWQEVSMDFNGPFKIGEYLLVVIDDYSRFREVEIVHSTSVQALVLSSQQRYRAAVCTVWTACQSCATRTWSPMFMFLSRA